MLAIPESGSAAAVTVTSNVPVESVAEGIVTPPPVGIVLSTTTSKVVGPEPTYETWLPVLPDVSPFNVYVEVLPDTLFVQPATSGKLYVWPLGLAVTVNVPLVPGRK